MAKAKIQGRPKKPKTQKRVQISIRIKPIIRTWVEEEAEKRGGLHLSQTIDILLTEYMNKLKEENEK